MRFEKYYSSISPVENAKVQLIADKKAYKAFKKAYKWYKSVNGEEVFDFTPDMGWIYARYQMYHCLIEIRDIWQGVLDSGYSLATGTADVYKAYSTKEVHIDKKKSNYPPLSLFNTNVFYLGGSQSIQHLYFGKYNDSLFSYMEIQERKWVYDNLLKSYTWLITDDYPALFLEFNDATRSNYYNASVYDHAIDVVAYLNTEISNFDSYMDSLYDNDNYLEYKYAKEIGLIDSLKEEIEYYYSPTSTPTLKFAPIKYTSTTGWSNDFADYEYVKSSLSSATGISVDKIERYFVIDSTTVYLKVNPSDSMMGVSLLASTMLTTYYQSGYLPNYESSGFFNMDLFSNALQLASITLAVATGNYYALVVGLGANYAYRKGYINRNFYYAIQIAVVAYSYYESSGSWYDMSNSSLQVLNLSLQYKIETDVEKWKDEIEKQKNDIRSLARTLQDEEDARIKFIFDDAFGQQYNDIYELPFKPFLDR